VEGASQQTKHKYYTLKVLQKINLKIENDVAQSSTHYDWDF
jgi:hypothetical protein